MFCIGDYLLGLALPMISEAAVEQSIITGTVKKKKYVKNVFLEMEMWKADSVLE